MNKAAFWFTNFVLCSNILKYPMFLLIFYVVATEHPYWPEWIFSDNSHPLIMLIVLGFPVLVIALHFLFKMRVFIFLYKHSKEGSYSRNFFEKFRDDSDFSESVITRAMVADFFVCWNFNNIKKCKTDFWGRKILINSSF